MSLTASIQVRLGSSRLPGKVLYHLGPKRVIEWVVERCETAETIDGVIVAVGDHPENDAIVEWCERHGVTYLTGPEGDLLKRHRQVARTGGTDPLVRITGDCPFVPPLEIDRVVREHRRRGLAYTTNVCEEMPIGTAVDVIDRAVLDELHEREKSHPVTPLRENPEEWHLAVSSADPWKQYANTHLAVDTPTDYWQLVDAQEAVGSDPQDVLSWLDQQ